MNDIRDIIQRLIDDPRLGGFDEHGGCVYRTTDGFACAVGCLLPDDVLEKMCLTITEDDGRVFTDACIFANTDAMNPEANIGQLADVFPEVLEITGLNAEQLTLLQDLHDGCANEPDPRQAVRTLLTMLLAGEDVYCHNYLVNLESLECA